MNALKAFLSLGLRKQIFAVLAVLITIGAMSLLTKQAMKPQLGLLYAGLDEKIAGEVIAELAAKNVAFEVRGSAIYAQADRRDALRLELAKNGLPRQSISGYELFDNVNSFAMTSDMFDTAYWRAKEGELARTILSLPSVDLVRVHFGTAKRSRFSGAPAAQSASVTLRSASGIDHKTAKSVQYLTALAVAGLDPNEVVVIDTALGIVAGPGSDGAMRAGQASSSMGEIERASAIENNLISILEARVGSGNVKVSVTLEVERNSKTIMQRSFDPDGRVVRSQTISEVTDTSAGKSAAVGVASNLPENSAGGAQNNSNRGETTETVSYELSETINNSVIPAGATKRISVAILVNDISAVDDDGVATSTPRTDAELTALTDLSLAAAGIDTARGDVLTLKAYAFDTPSLDGAMEQPNAMSSFIQNYLWSALQSGFLGLVALVLGLFVIKPILSGAGAPTLEHTKLGQMDMPALGMDIAGGLPAPQTELGLSGGLTDEPPQDPIEILREAARENPSEAAELLTSWLETENLVSSPAAVS